jgi:FecR protein
MTEHERRRPPDREERTLEQIFARAEPRPAPPAEETESIRQAVYAEWDAMTRRRVWLRRGLPLAAAAVVAAAGLAWLLSATLGANPPTAAPTVASVERVRSVPGVHVGDTLAEGAVVATSAGQVALRLAGGGSLRLGAETRLKLTGSSSAELATGVIYFDSGGERGIEAFTLGTPHGTVRDVGTQLVVRTPATTLEIGVRDGRAVLARAGRRHNVGAGDKLIAGSADGDVRREPTATFGEEWAWAERVAPPFDIDGRTLMDFLRWFEQQTGREIVFTDTTAERVARETVLNGSIDLEPLPKLAAVLTLTDLVYRLDGERVLISTK